MEGLDGLLESPWELLRGLDGSQGGLLVIWDSFQENLGAFWNLLQRSGGLWHHSWAPPGSLLGAFGRLLEGVWRSF